MKLKILLCLALCTMLLGCKEEPVNPGDPQVTMSSSSQTLVEGGEGVELTIELDRDIAKPYYLYLDYGDGYGENTVFFENSLELPYVYMNVNDKRVSVLAIPFLAGERKKTIRLKAEDNNWYRGDRPIEFKVLSLTNFVEKEPIYHASLNMDYRDNEPKPVFGILRNFSSDTELTTKAYPGEFKLTLIANIPFQFSQKIYLNYSGTAEEGTHFEGREYVVFEGDITRAFPYSQPALLRVKSGGNFSPEKNIRIQLSSAEDGGIAKEELLSSSTFGDYFNLILTAI